MNCPNRDSDKILMFSIEDTRGFKCILEIYCLECGYSEARNEVVEIRSGDKCYID